MSPIGRSARECSPPCAGCSSAMADNPGAPGRFSQRVAQEVELSFRDPADSCLLLVDRELQLAHNLAQLLQRLIGFAFLTQDHKIVGIGHDATAETLLQPELLPSQH